MNPELLQKYIAGNATEAEKHLQMPTTVSETAT